MKIAVAQNRDVPSEIFLVKRKSSFVNVVENRDFTVFYLDFISRQTYNSFYEVNSFVLGILENNYFSPFRSAKTIGNLVYKKIISI